MGSQHGRDQERFLAFEEIVEGPLGDPGHMGDVIHSRGFVAVLRTDLAGRIKNPMSLGFVLGGHRVAFGVKRQRTDWSVS